MKLGSLFDGSGTAPLCAAILGWEPVWASEIEPFPVKVTSKRFPRMKHLGNITKIDGAQIDPVDVIVGGSPCQDLSVAGKQAGLQNGTRSHLFYEMTRIIKEMREATNGKYPRYIVWENVPGAFSSNQGRDFHEVLKAFVACADHPGDVPEPPRGGGRAGADKLVWGNAGLIMGDGFSLGWRVLDAQYWGVPQRRRRIFLAVDLGGGRAGEILFEREGMYGHFEQGRAAREGAAAAAVGRADRGAGDGELNVKHLQGCINPVVYDCRGNADGKVAPNLTGDHGNRVTDYSACVVYPGVGITSKENASNPQPGDPCCTLDTDSRKYLVTENVPQCFGNGQMHRVQMSDVIGALNCMHDQQMIVSNGKPPRRYIVRRLTPMECSRLQGFPDWWVSGCETRPVTSWWAENEIWMHVIDPHGAVEGSDSAIYKMWGNGMALPCMLFVLSGMGGETS